MKTNEIEPARCMGCGKDIDESGLIFKCPMCQKQLARCGHCRKLTIAYKCPCGFEGP